MGNDKNFLHYKTTVYRRASFAPAHFNYAWYWNQDSVDMSTTVLVI